MRLGTDNEEKNKNFMRDRCANLWNSSDCEENAPIWQNEKRKDKKNIRNKPDSVRKQNRQNYEHDENKEPRYSTRHQTETEHIGTT
jgi:hypothetical protein